MALAKKIDLLDLATIFARWKRFLISFVFIISLIGTIIAFIWPKSYESEITFIVTDGNAINFSSGGLLSGLANLSVSGTNINSEQALILVRSSEMQDKIIDEFNLQEVYGKKIPEEIRKALNDNLMITETREGGLGFNTIIAITMNFTDESPERAYELVKYYYDILDETVLNLNRQGVEDGYLMLQSRLNQNEKELKQAEDSLVAYQKRYGILEVSEQAKAQVKALGDLKAEIVKLEIQIGYAIQTLGESNKKIEDLKVQKKQVEKKYSELLAGGIEQKDEFDVFKSMQDMPDLFIEYLRRYREVVIQEEIYKVLYPQYEQQKLNFEQANSGLRVIDPAILPTYKSAPKRLFIMAGAFLFACITGILIVLFIEWKKDLELNNVEEYHRFQEFTKELKRFK